MVEVSLKRYQKQKIKNVSYCAQLFTPSVLHFIVKSSRQLST